MKTIAVFLLITLCIGCGYGSKKVTPPTAGTVPTVAALVPDNVNAGSSNFILTINGSSFASNAQVNWNGAIQSTNIMAANQLTVNIPASMVATAGTVSISVTNPGTPGGRYGGGVSPATSGVKTFTINP